MVLCSKDRVTPEGQAMCRTLITLITLLAFTACTTMQTVQGTDAAAIRQSIQVGDRVRIQTHAGAVHELTVQRITDTSIDGVAADGRQQSVALDAIARLEKQAAAGGSRGWVVVAVVVA